MGLSDQERLEKIYWAIHHMVKLGHEIRQDPDASNCVGCVIEKVEQLWPAFIGGQSNSAHWILGSSASNAVTAPNSVWSTSILNHLEDSRQLEQKLKEEEEIKKTGQAPYEAPFDAFDNGFLDIAGLLGQCHYRGKFNRHLYELFGWSEQLAYALRRYDDELLKSFQSLSDVLARLQGELFGFFSANNDFAKAYVLNQVLDHLYRDKDFQKLAYKQHWHHDLSRPMRSNRDDSVSLEKVREWHYRAVVNSKKQTTEDKILLALEIMGRHYHYQHNYNDMVSVLQADNVLFNPKKLESAFKKCEARHKELEEAGHKEYRNDSERDVNAAIHGWDFQGRGKK